MTNPGTARQHSRLFSSLCEIVRKMEVCRAGPPQLSSHALDKQHKPFASLADISHISRCIDCQARSGF